MTLKAVAATICMMLACIAFNNCNGQKGTVALGIEYKPIFPVKFLRTGPQSYTDSGIVYTESLQSGFGFGMVIRKTFSKLLAFEAGITYTQRKYLLEIKDGSFTEEAEFHIIGYEIPVSVLMYAQAGEKTFMNASMGVSPDMFASNVQTTGERHRSYTARNHTFQPAIIANIGIEYRTEQSGYFYLGATYHGPFNNVFSSNIFYKEQNGHEHSAAINLSGNYLTVNLRYFFAPDSGKKKKSAEETE
jgi:hypothetical protein